MSKYQSVKVSKCQSIKVSKYQIPNSRGDYVMKKYVCTVCGYVYDPAEGDEGTGVAAGTAFENIDDAWLCPVCGVDKAQFEEE